MIRCRPAGIVCLIIVLLWLWAGSAANNSRAQTAPASALAGSKPTELVVGTVALEMPVTDVEANIAFFEKLGFVKRWADSSTGQVRRASMESGVLRIRLFETRTPKPKGGVTPYFWIDGGETALIQFRNTILSHALNPAPITTVMSLKQFTLATPDGYTLGFYAQADSGL